MSGVGVGVTVGNAACTMAATVASILIVGAGVVVGTGACVAQASPMIPEVSSINAKGRSRIQIPSAIRAAFYQNPLTTIS